MNTVIRRLVGSIFLLMVVAWVLLELFVPAMPFLIALWLLSIFGAGIFARRKW